MSTLKGRVAVITGAGKGLGKAMALALAEQGCTLALVGRNTELLKECATLCSKSQIKAECFQADVTSEEQVVNLEKQVKQKLGALK